MYFPFPQDGKGCCRVVGGCVVVLGMCDVREAVFSPGISPCILRLHQGMHVAESVERWHRSLRHDLSLSLSLSLSLYIYIYIYIYIYTTSFHPPNALIRFAPDNFL